jgi:hypothetical protein
VFKTRNRHGGNRRNESGRNPGPCLYSNQVSPLTEFHRDGSEVPELWDRRAIFIPIYLTGPTSLQIISTHQRIMNMGRSALQPDHSGRPPSPPTPPGGIWFALNPLNFADQPEFGSQEEFSSPPQVYGWNELWPTRDFREAEADLLFLFFIRALHRP